MNDFDRTYQPAEDDAEAVASAASVRQVYAALAPELLDDEAAEPAAPAVPEDDLRAQVVRVLLVAHDGARWLPTALRALAAVELPPASVHAVDTGSTDGTVDLITAAPLVSTVDTLPRDAGYSAAVRTAWAAVPARPELDDETSEWLWLLHDDCAPHPDVLRHLLTSAIEHDAAVVGPKVLSWDGQRRLVEMGLSITGSGRRYTWLEGHEFDQGQHDDRLDVLAVGTAGMLVRRDVWEVLGGLDPQIELFRDDVDFGWRARLAGYRVVVSPDAVVEHVAAATQGRRRSGATGERGPLVDRRNAVHVLLANARTVTFLPVLLRVLVGSMLRAVGFVLGKVPGVAYDEMVAVAGALHPGRLRAARRWRRSQPRGGSIAGLRPTLGTQLRHATDNLRDLVSGQGGGHDVPGARRRASAQESEPGDEGPPALAVEPWITRVAARPGIILVLITAAFAVLAGRSVLFGGRLVGGALLPPLAGSGDLWTDYLASWHPIGLGSAEGAPFFAALLAGFAVPLFGSVSGLVTAILLLSLPLAAGTAWWALRGVTDSLALRVWSVVAYTAVLLGSGAISAGRLGTAGMAVLAPLLVRSVPRAMEPTAPLHRVWSTSLLVAVATAFAPIVWPVSVTATAIGALLWSRRLRTLVRWLTLAVVPVLLLVPWSLDWLDRPELLVMEPGLTGTGAQLADPALPTWAVVLLSPGGPGSLSPGLLAVVPVLAFVGLVVGVSSRLVATGWVLSLTAMAAAVVTTRTEVSSPLGEGAAAGWPGPAVVLAGLGMLVAVAAGVEPGRLAARSRMLAALSAVVAVGSVATVAGLGLARGFDEPLQRRDPTMLPAYVQDESVGPDRVRTLVVRADGSGSDRRVTFSLLRGADPRIGHAEISDSASTDLLGAVVADLLAGRGAATIGDLAGLAVRYVYAPSPSDPAIVDALDSQPGLVRSSASEGGAIWRIEGTVARARLLTPDQPRERAVGTPVPSGPVDVTADIAESSARRLVLAELADQGWRAALDGEPLDRVDDGTGLVAFAVPAGGGELTVEHHDSTRGWLLLVQGLAWLLVVVLAVPSLGGRRTSLEGGRR